MDGCRLHLRLNVCSAWWLSSSGDSQYLECKISNYIVKGFLDPRGPLRVPLMSAYVRPYARPQQKFLLLQFHLFLPPQKPQPLPLVDVDMDIQTMSPIVNSQTFLAQFDVVFAFGTMSCKAYTCPGVAMPWIQRVSDGHIGGVGVIDHKRDTVPLKEVFAWSKYQVHAKHSKVWSVGFSQRTKGL